MTGILEVEGVSVEIDTDSGPLRPVLDVSLSVDRGEILAIVGESGSGKSVTALSIMGLLPRHSRLTAARIQLDGQSLLALSDDEWRRVRGGKLSMIFQDPMTALDPYYTVGKQMIEILRQHERVTRSEATRRVLDVLAMAQIRDPHRRMQQYPHELSGGLRQRVMIAMAILCQPSLLIADEPTTALDVTTQARILKLLTTIKEQKRVGIIIITHDIGVVACIANRVVVMYRGQVVEYGSVQNVLGKPFHPYTEGLLRSVIVPGRGERGAPLGSIPGIVPAPVGIPEVCAFAPRCPYVSDACMAPIALREYRTGHHARCVLTPDDGRRRPHAWA